MYTRFASPDPFIPNATATQSYNRYSYCINNPLKYTDPSGYADKPADWNKGFSGALYVNPCYMGGYTHLGPGSGNHWSDQYRSEFGNFMIGSSDGFDRIYGIGAWATALSVLTNPNLEWVSGKGNKPGIYVKEAKYHFNGWKGDKSSGYTADGEFELINRFIPFSGRENGESATGEGANFDISNLALDIGGGIYGGLRTAVTPGDQWLGTNGKYNSNFWRGNRYTGSRSGAFAASNTYKWAGRATVGATAIIGGIQVYNGYQMDGGQFGYNANLAGASATGSIVGGWAGAEAGAYSFGIIGGMIGGPPGAIIGAVIGGFVGGIGGSLTGNMIGEIGVNYYYGR